MTFTISKEFAFSASHQLHGLREGHPCGRVHGHNYIVKVAISGTTLDTHGFVVDYGDLKPFGQWIDDHLDHRHLNDVLRGMQPSAENLAKHLHTVLGTLVQVPVTTLLAVSVSETPKTWATYQP